MTERDISTRPFLTTSGDYFGVVLGAWMRRYGWSMLIPVCVFLGLGLARSDERWYIVALLVIFIVAPMVMSFIYTYYMLTPEARRAVLPKRVTVHPGREIILEYVSPAELPKDDDTAEETQQKNPGNETPGDSAPVPPPETIPWSDMTGVRSTSRFLVYSLRGERMQFVLIPWSAIIR